jgi:hypothetical protein
MKKLKLLITLMILLFFRFGNFQFSENMKKQ